MSRRHLVLLVAITSLVAACGSTGPASTSPTTPDSIDSTDLPESPGPDSDWIAVEGTIDGQPVELIDGYEVTLSISGNEIAGTAACNGYRGFADFGTRTISVGGLDRTEMGCEAAVQALEQQYLTSLSALDGYRLDGERLVLTGADVMWTFAPGPPVPITELVDTTWVLDTYRAGDTESHEPGMERATLTFVADGTVVGTTNCRSLTGTWVDAGGQILIPDLAAEGACPGAAAQDLDSRIIGVLGDGFGATIDGDRLRVSQGELGLTFHAVTDSPTGTTSPQPPTPPPTTAPPTTAPPATSGSTSAELDAGGGVDGPVVYWQRPEEDGGEQAGIDGAIVSFGDDGCIRIGSAVMVWRYGTRWRPEPPAVIANGVTIGDGDRIVTAGGYHDVENLEFFTTSDKALDQLRRCRPVGNVGVFVVQHPVVGVAAPNADLDPAGGFDGPLMYWQDCVQCEQEMARIDGILRLDGECLTVEEPDGDRLSILWPYGTRWHESPASVVLLDGQVVAIDEQLQAGGGYHQPDQLTEFTVNDAIVERALACTTGATGEVVVVQSR